MKFNAALGQRLRRQSPGRCKLACSNPGLFQDDISAPRSLYATWWVLKCSVMAAPSLCCFLVTLWTFCFLVADVSAASRCGYYSSYGYYTYRYCSYGCCGTTYAYVCCSSTTRIVLSGAAITGIVIGVVTMAVVIFIILIVLMKKKHWRGRRVVGHGNVVVSSSSTATKPVSTVQVGPPVPQNPYPAYPPPAYPAPQQPPSTTPAYPPPQQPYTANDPAYPPSPPSYTTTTTSHVYY
ncbi:uncharacterized protein [Haliotis asinina]|uniref:uncharacterized protein n=1 Tax=Haliotis asinina TaxID=109174 RepID=UPI0035324298